MTAKAACGRLYCEWAEANKIRSPPKIDICIKFYRVSDFMAKDGTFKATLVLMLDWEDPSVGAWVDSKDYDGKIDWGLHFCPSWEIVNAVSYEIVGGMGKGHSTGLPLPRYKRNHPTKGKKYTPFGPEHRVTLTVKYN